MAALVPVMLAATAVIAAFALLGPISQVFPLDDSVKTVMLLIGMAVGVDYALFYVVRSREERLRDASTREALERTSRTSGRSVLIAGTTVAIAMAGQFVVGSDIFNGTAARTIVVVACAVAGSVTVLPALLRLLGPHIDHGRIPFLPQLATAGESRFWAAVVERVLRRPVLAAGLSGRAAGGARRAGARAARGQAERGRALLGWHAVILREGLARLLQEAGFEVVGVAADADELLELVDRAEPDVAIVDIRMPPTHTDEGLRAANAPAGGQPARASHRP